MGLGILKVVPRPIPAVSRDLPEQFIASLLQREEMHTKLDSKAREELLSLAQERDPVTFFEGLLAFGVRQEQSDRIELAGSIFSSVAELDSFPALQQHARQRLDAVMGRGATGTRAEFLLRRFAQEAAGPAMIAGMAGAQAIFGLSRAALLTRLAASPTGNFFTRGLGARVLASTGAYLLEAPGFVSCTRGAGAVFGQTQDWRLSTLSREVAGSYLALGAMRLTGWLGGSRPMESLRSLSTPASMFGGIYLGHALETRLGLRERLDGATTFVDSLAMLLQFQVGGRLMRQALGPGIERFNQELNLRSESFGENFPPRSQTQIHAWSPLLETASSRIPVMPHAGMGKESWLPMQMSGEVDGGEPKPNPPVVHPYENFQLPLLPETCRCLKIAFHGNSSYLWNGIRPKFIQDILSQIRQRFSELPGLEETRLRFSDGRTYFFSLDIKGAIQEFREEADQARALEFYNRYPSESIQGIQILGPWKAREITASLPELLLQARTRLKLSPAEIATHVETLTQSPKTADTIRRYEKNTEQAIPLETLRALARLYDFDPRDLIHVSNRTRFPQLSPQLWTTESYPIYLEEKSDLQRLEYYRERDPKRQSLGWMVFEARKNPFRYLYTRDFRHSVGQESGIVDIEENHRYPSLKAVQGLGKTLGLEETALIDAANRTFFPELNLAKLFPEKHIHLDQNSIDVRKVRGYMERPGSPGQLLFGYRKSLPDHPSVHEMSERLGLPRERWRELELNQHLPNARNWLEWYDLLKKLKLPFDPIRPWLRFLDRYQENFQEMQARLGTWRPRKLRSPLPEFLHALREKSSLSLTDVARLVAEMTGETKSWSSIRDYEAQSDLAIPYKFLHALAEIYGADVRDLVLVSNQTRFPSLPRAAWLTDDYPIYLENEGDLERLKHYQEHPAGRENLGWRIYAARKNPLRYFNTVDFQERSGLSGKALNRLELNCDYPTPRVLTILGETLEISEADLLTAANRSFHPSLKLHSLFPGQNIYLQPHSYDAAKVEAYLQRPNSPGQLFFAFRKSQPGYPSAKEMSLRVGHREDWWGNRELNQPTPNSANWAKWQRLLGSLGISSESLSPWDDPI